MNITLFLTLEYFLKNPVQQFNYTYHRCDEESMRSGPEHTYHPDHILPADRAVCQSFATLSAGYHVTTLQQDAVH